MDQEYTITIFSKIFYSILSIGMFVFAIFLFSIYKPSVTSVVLLFPISILIISVLILINVFKRRIILSEQSVFYSNIFATKELAIEAIKGCRIESKVIFKNLLQKVTLK